MLSGRMAMFTVICWMLLTGPLAAPTTAQEITLLPSARADLFSRVTLTPGPLAHLKDEQEKTNSTQTTPQQLQGPQQQASVQHSDTSHDRLFWALPNFLTVENAENVPPLTPGQKFKLVARGIYDPVEFVLVGFVAGLGQASNSDPSYGQGAQGYAKRYGTAYADNAIENFMAYAVFPSVLHQDPRFYQLGHGGFRKRALHAISRVVITRSDSGQTQFNYSELLGASSAAAISTYTYHPQSERSFGNVASVLGTQMAWDVATYLAKEFWPDLRKKKDKQQ